MQKPFNCISIGHKLLTVLVFFAINIAHPYTYPPDHIRMRIWKKAKRVTFACNKLTGQSTGKSALSNMLLMKDNAAFIYIFYSHTHTHTPQRLKAEHM